tara:strand:- start:725 stop:1609 length:885 start_codon:yes stop_codon:yes gene_type:complete
MVVAIEDSGFEVRDMISWISNKTFPKSLDVSKAIDKAAGAERKVIGSRPLTGTGRTMRSGFHQPDGSGAGETIKQEVFEITAPSTPEAQKWQGWGTGLKPTVEPIVMARKPLIGTVAANVLEHGTGALNIDGSRIGTEERTYQGGSKLMEERPWSAEQKEKPKFVAQGRWPANVILDEYSSAELDEQIDSSRFFYVARTSKRDRNEGLEGSNFHPTVKPTTLMRYLVKLVTPPGGIVLDPFTGSGSTGKAAILEGFDFIGIELTEEYLPIIESRLAHAEKTVIADKDKIKEALF